MAAIKLKEIPIDVIRHILKVQSDMKVETCRGFYSQAQAVIKIIREHKSLTENVKVN